MNAPKPKLPWMPELERADRTAAETAAAVGVTRRTLHRWKAAGEVPLAIADRLAVAAGRHPSEVWPDYFERIDAERRARRAALERRRYRANLEAERARSRAYYAEVADYVRAHKRRTYWQDVETSRARLREKDRRRAERRRLERAAGQVERREQAS